MEAGRGNIRHARNPGRSPAAARGGYGRIHYDTIASGVLAKLHGNPPKQLTRSAVATYVVIVSHANGNDEAWPSIDTIALKSGASRPSVKRAIKELVIAGLVVVESGCGRHKPNVYRLTQPQCELARPAPTTATPVDAHGRPLDEHRNGIPF